jgi:PAS domain-containing protein
VHVASPASRRLSKRAARLRKQNSAGPVEMQERLREAHELVRLASWEWRSDSNEVVIFQALAEASAMSGRRVSLDQVLGTMPADDRRAAQDELEALARGDHEESTMRYCHDFPDGQAWLEVRSRAVRDHKGRLVRVRGTIQEVTEQHLATKELAQARDFFQGTLDSLPSHIAVLDERGEIIMTNRAWSTFALANDAATAEGVGANYLTACDAAKGDELATQAGAGLRAIIAGTSRELTLEYPCHGPDVERWFVLRAGRLRPRSRRRRRCSTRWTLRWSQSSRRAASPAGMMAPSACSAGRAPTLRVAARRSCSWRTV